MPPMGRPPSSFVAIWVEDGTAKLWRVELNTGAMDELARFSAEGMTRPAVLEIARMFIRGRGPDRSIPPELMAPATNGTTPAPVTRTGRPRTTGRGTMVKRAEQIARQGELLEALGRHPEGITAQALYDEIGRPATNGAGVPLGLLARQGLARRDRNGPLSPTTGHPVSLWFPTQVAP